MNERANNWSELHRTDDIGDALTIVTTIASMEFEVRWTSSDRPVAHHANSELLDEEAGYGQPPYVIEVPADSFGDLIDVLPMILDEQEEFEAAYSAKQEIRQSIVTLILIGLTLVPLLFAILSGLLAYGAERFDEDRTHVVAIG